MIFTRMKLALAGLLLVTTAPLANADLIDFGTYANLSDLNSGFNTGQPDNERAFAFGNTITPSTSGNPTTISVKLFAWTNSNPNGNPLSSISSSADTTDFVRGPPAIGITGPFAYLNSKSGPNGGLGVSSSINTNRQAVPSSDDNVSAIGAGNTAEVLGLEFLGGSYQVSGFVFRDADHNPLSSGKLDFWNGTSWQEDLSIGAGTGSLVVDLSPGQFIAFAYNNKQFYVDSLTAKLIPEPGSLFTFAALNGMMGFCMTRRRRRTA